MRPYSDNIIFLDTEFSSLDPYKGELLSVGLVKVKGEELYLELEHAGEVDKWVRENVLPLLVEQKVSREEAVEKINEFIGDEEPYAVAYVNQFDSIYFHKLFGIHNVPFHWIPIDFASMLFALGINPESYDLRDRDNFFRGFLIDHTKYRQHHALDDARLLREVYLKSLEKLHG